jgi:hypothetical protein
LTTRRSSSVLDRQKKRASLQRFRYQTAYTPGASL